MNKSSPNETGPKRFFRALAIGAALALLAACSTSGTK
jgi:hypothetical protein